MLWGDLVAGKGPTADVFDVALKFIYVQWGDKSIDPNPAYATRSCRVAFSSHTHLFCRLSGQAHN